MCLEIKIQVALDIYAECDRSFNLHKKDVHQFRAVKCTDFKSGGERALVCLPTEDKQVTDLMKYGTRCFSLT